MPIDACSWCEEDNPDLTENILIAHMLGHIAFGLIVAIPAWKLKYIVASGLFVVAIDFDHVLRYLLRIFEYDFTIDLISRSGHSVVFALIIAVVLMLAYGRRDYLLGAVAGASVFGHMAFDIFGNSGVFPMFMPFTNEAFYFNQDWWFIILLTGLSIVLLGKSLTWRKEYLEKQEHL